MPTTYRRRRLFGVFAAITLLMLAGTAQAARTLDTAYGDVDIDGTPERVVTLYEGALDAAVALGTTPVAAIATRGGDGVATYIRERVPGIALVGTARETNIEAVVAQRPDIILASSNLSAPQYRLLSKIAPTVVPKGSPFAANAWQNETRLFARALDREDKAGQLIDAFQTRAAHISAQIPDGTQATIARWMPQGPLVMSPRIFAGRVLDAAGFDTDGGARIADDRPHSDPLSLENLDHIDSDWLFLATLNADGESALAKARTSPAFERLDVAQRDHVVPVDGQLWTSASGPLAANAILDDIARALGIAAQP